MCLRKAATILVIGGCTAIREEGALRSIEAIEVHLEEGSSPVVRNNLKGSFVKNLHTPRRAPSTALISGPHLAAIGGCSGPKSHLSSIEVLGLVDENGSEPQTISSNLPGHSCAASCSLRPDTIVIVGGFDGYDSLKQVSVVKFNEKVPLVKRLDDFCSKLKNAGAIKKGDQEMLVIGGWDGTRTLRTIFALNFDESLSSYKWTVTGVLPHPIEGHSVSKWKDTLLITGGFDGIAVTDCIIRFDLNENTSRILPVRLRTARENHTSQIIGNFLFVLGGWNGREALDSIELSNDGRRVRPSIYCQRMDSDVRLVGRFNESFEKGRSNDVPQVESLFDEQMASTSARPPPLVLVELTSLDELSFPTSSTRRIKYTCVTVSKRFLIVGTCTGTVYIFSRYASRHRTKLASLPVSVFTTKDGSVNKLLISPTENHVAVGSESGRISVASLSAEQVNNSTPTLVYTVGGDVRRMDRVTALCWSPQGDQLFAGHYTGKLTLHRIMAKSVFRQSQELICQFDAQIVQICHSISQLLVSTSSYSYLVPLDTRQPAQVGRKVRNEPMGACFCENAETSFIVTARPHGRLWEANLAATVYRTHQFRHVSSLFVYPVISFRAPLSLDQPGTIEDTRQLIDFALLDPVSYDGNQLVGSIVGDRCVVADIENNPPALRLVAAFGGEIVDHSWCGADLFVLYAGDGRLRKFTLLTEEKAIEKLCFKKAYKQAAKVLLQIGSVSFGDDKLVHSVIEGLQQTNGIRSSESELLVRQIREKIGHSGGLRLPTPSLQPTRSIRSPRTPPSMANNIRESPPKIAKNEPRTLLQRPSRLPASVASILNRYSVNRPLKSLNVGTHRVHPKPLTEQSGYEDDFTFKLLEKAEKFPSKFGERIEKKERSKSTSPVVKNRRSPINAAANQVPEKWMSEDEARSDRLLPANPNSVAVIRKAKNLLETREFSDPEVDSLRTLLGLDTEKPYECVEFTPTVTLASAPRSLAKLAQAVPLDIVETIKVERRATRTTTSIGGQRPSSRESLSSGGSSINARKLGPRILKTIRPNRLSGQGLTGMPRKVEVRTSIINTENLDNRFDLTTLVHGSKGHLKSLESVEVKLEETRHLYCPECSLHRSWLAVCLVIRCTGRVVVSTEMEGRGRVPHTSRGWKKLFEERMAIGQSTQYLPLIACQSCLAVLNSLENVFRSQSNIQSTSTAPIVQVEEWRPQEIERIRRRALAMSDEHIQEIFFGLAKKGDEKKDQRTDDVPLNFEEKTIDPGSSSFLKGVSNSVLFGICACCVGVEELCQWLQETEWSRIGEKMLPVDWSLLVSIQSKFLPGRRMAGYLMPIQSIKAILKEQQLVDFIQIDRLTMEKEKSIDKTSTAITSPSSALPARRTVSTRPVVVKSWIADLSRNCLLCTLPLGTIVGGIDSGVVTYFCGHSFHRICVEGTTSIGPPCLPSHHSPSSPSPSPQHSPVPSPIEKTALHTIPPMCIACRIRNSRPPVNPSSLLRK